MTSLRHLPSGSGSEALPETDSALPELNDALRDPVRMGLLLSDILEKLGRKASELIPAAMKKCRS